MSSTSRNLSLGKITALDPAIAPTQFANCITNSQPPEDTVQTHIRRLKEYNNLKDIGQQLIGLIAENRGVRVGTLYETGEFGVSADD